MNEGRQRWLARSIHVFHAFILQKKKNVDEEEDEASKRFSFSSGTQTSFLPPSLSVSPSMRACMYQFSDGFLPKLRLPHFLAKFVYHNMRQKRSKELSNSKTNPWLDCDFHSSIDKTGVSCSLEEILWYVYPSYGFLISSRNLYTTICVRNVVRNWLTRRQTLG